MDFFGAIPCALYLLSPLWALEFDVFGSETPFLGKKLVSTPYEGCNGGFSCSDLEVRKALVDKVLACAEETGVKYVEIGVKTVLQK